MNGWCAVIGRINFDVGESNAVFKTSEDFYYCFFRSKASRQAGGGVLTIARY